MSENTMVKLVPMTDGEFDAFMEISMQIHAQDQVKAGFWQVHEADEKTKSLRSQVLPEGLGTPGHFFFSIEDIGTGNRVGGLWYLILERKGEEQIFVMDIQIDEIYHSSRTDFICTAIRNLLDKHNFDNQQVVTRNSFAIGALHYNHVDLEKYREKNEKVNFRVIGVLSLDADISVKLALDVIESLQVRGVFHASPAVKEVLANRMR